MPSISCRNPGRVPETLPLGKVSWPRLRGSFSLSLSSCDCRNSPFFFCFCVVVAHCVCILCVREPGQINDQLLSIHGVIRAIGPCAASPRLLACCITRVHTLRRVLCVQCARLTHIGECQLRRWVYITTSHFILLGAIKSLPATG